MRPRRSVVAGFADAGRGVGEALRRERNLRFHVAAACVVLIAAVALRFTPVELAVIVLVIALVIVAELINTAVEAAVDLATREIDPLARLAKDVAAGAVLCASGAAAVIGVLLFWHHLR